MTTSSDSGESSRRGLIRWAGAGAFVLAAHAGVVFAALNWPQPKIAAGDPPAAVMIELAPLPVAPEAVPQEVAVGPTMNQSQDNTPSERKDQEEPVPEETPQETKKDVEIPELPDKPNATAVLPAPAPEPEKEKPKEKEKEAKKKKKERSKPRPVSRNAPNTSAPQEVVAPRAQANAAPSPGASSSMSSATWRSALMAHLNRHKHFPAGGSRGTSSIAFTIDRSGRVLSARLVRSSGDSVLDQEAVSLARRASPVPPPPPDIAARGTILLSVPIRFNE